MGIALCVVLLKVVKENGRTIHQLAEAIKEMVRWRKE